MSASTCGRPSGPSGWRAKPNGSNGATGAAREPRPRQCDRVLRVLEAWGYVDGWSLTAAGQRLVRVYHESDLLVAECLQQGLLDGLEGPELAGLVSGFTYESRGPGEPTAWFPGGRLRERWSAIDQLAAELNSAED